MKSGQQQRRRMKNYRLGYRKSKLSLSMRRNDFICGRKQLAEKEVIIRRANKRAENAETEIEKITGQLLVTQKELETMSKAREEEIKALNDQLKQKVIDAKEEQEKREEL